MGYPTLVPGVYKSTAPTLTDEQQHQLRMDASGNLLVAPGIAAVGSAAVLYTITSTVTRPGDTNAYVINDVWATSTSAPTVGGNTFTDAARVSGGSGVIRAVELMASTAAAINLQGELHIFDSAVTAVNDNAAFALSDADAAKRVCRLPFWMQSEPSNAICHLTDLYEPYTCVGTANLRYLIRVKNAYSPATSEILTVRLMVERTN